jgi:anti-sigma-K factor RskA
MDISTYINSGILELYVYGLCTDDENREINELSKQHQVIENEIISIEKSIINLSSSFSPFLSSDNFSKIKQKLELKHQVIQMKPKSNFNQYLGWGVAAAFVLGFGFLLNENNKNQEIKDQLEKQVAATQVKFNQNKEALAVVTDTNNTIVALAGQTVAPTAYAKVYWNKNKQSVYIDAKGLPEPPEGKVYQIWSLKLSPTLTPTSIGTLENFASNDNKIFKVDGTNTAEAFGITLEPAGGSKSPTMEQLYTLGKV